jgi:hypothetical protein
MHDFAAMRGEKPFICIVLGCSARKIDRLPLDVTQLAFRDPRADRSCDCDAHARIIHGMKCDHSDPPEVMERAEAWLRERGIPPEKWSGKRFRHAENTPNAKGWKSVVIEIERRDGEWIVTGIDRRPDPVTELGLSIAS